MIEIYDIQLLSSHNNDPSPINKKKSAPEVCLVDCTNSNIHGLGQPNRFLRQRQCNTLKVKGEFN